MQCIFPLVFTKHEKIQPVIDNCFLPCRNPLISSSEKFHTFRILRAVFCVFFAILCSSIFIFLSARSKIFATSHSIFSIACCLLCFSVHLATFALGSFSYFAEMSECTRGEFGVNIRSDPINDMASTWCIVSALVQHLSLLCSIGFLVASYPLSAAGATARSRREKNQRSGENSSWFRTVLVILVSVASLLCGIPAVLLKMISTDGVAGVCAFGLHSTTDHLTFIAAPGLIFCLISFAVGSGIIWREKKQRERDVATALEERIKEKIQNEKERRKRELCETGGGPETERDGEDEVLVLERDCDANEFLSEDKKKEVSDDVRKEKHEEWRLRDKKEEYESIPRRYTLVALCLCMVFLLISVGIHWFFLDDNGRNEYDVVREYVTCVISKSIVRKEVSWLSNPAHAAEKWSHGRGENDPLERRNNLDNAISIHNCSLPSTGDGRLFGLFFVFILLPLLPVAVFIVAFFAGLAGIDGMVSVKQRRISAQKTHEEKNDVEMSLLFTETADASPILRKRMLVSHPNDQPCSSNRDEAKYATAGVSPIPEKQRLVSTPNDQPCSSSDQIDWVPLLRKEMAIIGTYFGDKEFPWAANSAMTLGSLAAFLKGRDPINYQVLDHVHKCLQKLARDLELRIVTSDLHEEVEVAIEAVKIQEKINLMPNSRDCLVKQFALNNELDRATPDAQQLFVELDQNEKDEARRDEIINQFLSGANRRTVHRLAAGSFNHFLIPPPPSPAQEEKLQLHRKLVSNGAPPMALSAAAIPWQTTCMGGSRKRKTPASFGYEPPFKQRVAHGNVNLQPSTSAAAAAAPPLPGDCAPMQPPAAEPTLRSCLEQSMRTNAVMPPILPIQEAHSQASSSSERSQAFDPTSTSWVEQAMRVHAVMRAQAALLQASMSNGRSQAFDPASMSSEERRLARALEESSITGKVLPPIESAHHLQPFKSNGTLGTGIVEATSPIATPLLMFSGTAPPMRFFTTHAEHRKAIADAYVEEKKRREIKRVKRCGHCKKSVAIIAFSCHCGGHFCSEHRYDSAHACTFDYKKMGRAQIERTTQRA